MALARRLVFGEVAELYESARPAYPEALIDDLVAIAGLAQDARAVEVGAGTGKATRMMARRGVRIVAVEPSAPMAAIGRRVCAEFPGVRFVEADFEQWDAGPERVPLVYSAQAWHWVAPELRHRRARAALSEGGRLAAFWNRVDWPRSPARSELIRVFSEAAPQLDIHMPMHPANPDPAADDDWEGDIASAPEFDRPRIEFYDWEMVYGAREFTDLLATLSEVRLQGAAERTALLQNVADTIEAMGGSLPLPMRTRLCLAQAV